MHEVSVIAFDLLRIVQPLRGINHFFVELSWRSLLWVFCAKICSEGRPKFTREIFIDFCNWTWPFDLTKFNKDSLVLCWFWVLHELLQTDLPTRNSLPMTRSWRWMDKTSAMQPKLMSSVSSSMFTLNLLTLNSRTVYLLQLVYHVVRWQNNS